MLEVQDSVFRQVKTVLRKTDRAAYMKKYLKKYRKAYYKTVERYTLTLSKEEERILKRESKKHEEPLQGRLLKKAAFAYFARKYLVPHDLKETLNEVKWSSKNGHFY